MFVLGAAAGLILPPQARGDAAWWRLRVDEVLMFPRSHEAARFRHVDRVKDGPHEQSERGKKSQLCHRFTLCAVCEEAAVHLMDVLA